MGRCLACLARARSGAAHPIRRWPLLPALAIQPQHAINGNQKIGLVIRVLINDNLSTFS
jgi:hypothetical protein